MPADITVFQMEQGEFELGRFFKQTRKADTRFRAPYGVQGRVRFDTDLNRCQDEKNWFMHIAEDFSGSVDPSDIETPCITIGWRARIAFEAPRSRGRLRP